MLIAVRVRWINWIIIDSNIRKSSMRNILEKSHFGIITSWNIIIEYSNTLHTSSNPDGTWWNASRNHISVLNVLAITKRTEYTWTSRGIPRVMNTTAFTCECDREFTLAVQNDFHVRAQKPRVTQCILTRDIVHWITLEKVPLILPREEVRFRLSDRDTECFFRFTSAAQC